MLALFQTAQQLESNPTFLDVQQKWTSAEPVVQRVLDIPTAYDGCAIVDLGGRVGGGGGGGGGGSGGGGGGSGSGGSGGGGGGSGGSGSGGSGGGGGGGGSGGGRGGFM